jgi:hypothetical protein
LLKLNAPERTFYRNDVLFVGMAGCFLARDQKLTFLLMYISDAAGDGRAVHVDVEHV